MADQSIPVVSTVAPVFGGLPKQAYGLLALSLINRGWIYNHLVRSSTQVGSATTLNPKP